LCSQVFTESDRKNDTSIGSQVSAVRADRVHVRHMVFISMGPLLKMDLHVFTTTDRMQALVSFHGNKTPKRMGSQELQRIVSCTCSRVFTASGRTHGFTSLHSNGPYARVHKSSQQPTVQIRVHKSSQQPTVQIRVHKSSQQRTVYNSQVFTTADRIRV